MRTHRCVVLAVIAVIAIAGCASTARVGLPPGVGPGGLETSQAAPFVLQGGQGHHWALLRLPGQNSNFQGLASRHGEMWVADYNGAAMWRAAMNGNNHRFSLGNFFPQSIVLGANGNFYMNTPSGAPAVAEVTPFGNVSIIDLPPLEWSYGTMVVGPDRNVWITEQRHVGRIDASGSVKQYPAPGQCNVAGSGITAGPDNEIWYTASCTNEDEVVKLDPQTGKATAYPVSSSLQCPPGGKPIVSASDGALWFGCNSRAGLIGRITTSGEIETHPIKGTALIAMANGPDGNIWYVDDLGDASLLGKIDPATAGVVTFTPPKNFGRMQGITAGPDGNVWMSAGSQLDVYLLRALIVTPASLSFNGIGQSSNLTVTERLTSAWTASSSNAGIASVSTTNQPDVFVVQSTGQGKCTITIKDAVGNLVRVPVTVGSNTPLPSIP